MNSISLSGEVKYVRYVTTTGQEIITEVINSPTINHQLLSMTYAYNYDEEVEPLEVIQMEGLDSSKIGIKELASMNKVLVMQSAEGDADNKFEFKSLLDSNSITSIDLPKGISVVELYDFNWTLVSTVNFEELGENYLKSRKLFILTYSSSQLNNVSPEIHDKMTHPHKDVKTLIMTISDLDELTQVENLVNEQFRFIPTNTLLADKKEKYEIDSDPEEFADTMYALGIRNREKVNAIINFEEIEL